MEVSNNWSNEALLTFADAQNFYYDDFGFNPIIDDLSNVFINTDMPNLIESLEYESESSSSTSSYMNSCDMNRRASFDSNGWTSTDHSFETDYENLDFESFLGEISDDQDFWQEEKVVKKAPHDDFEVKPPIPIHRKRKSSDSSSPTSRKRRRNYITEKLDEVVQLLRKHRILGVTSVKKTIPKASDSTSLLFESCGSFINSFMSGDFNPDDISTFLDNSICISVPSLSSLASYFTHVEQADDDNPMKSKGLAEVSNDQDNAASRCDIIGVASVSVLSRQVKSSFTTLLRNHVNPHVTDSDFTLSAELAQSECDVISANLEKCSLRFLWKSRGLCAIGLTRELHVYGLVQFSRVQGLITSMFVSFDKATVLRQLNLLA